MLYYHLVLSALLLGADLATARPTPAAPPPNPGQYPPSGSQPPQPPQRPPPARQGTSYVPTAQQVQQGFGAAAWASGGTVPFVLGTGHTAPGLGMAGTSLVTGAASYGMGRYNRPPASDIENQRVPQPPPTAYGGGPSRANTVGSSGGPPQPPQQPSRANTVQYPPPQLPPAAHTYSQGSASSLGPQQHTNWAGSSTPSVQGGGVPQGWSSQSSHSSLQPPPVAYSQQSPQAASSSAVQGVQGVRQRPGAQSSTSVNSGGSGSSSGVSSGVTGYGTPEGKGSASSLGHQSGQSGGR